MSAEPRSATGTASSVLIAVLARGMRRRIEEALAPTGVRPRHLLVLNHLRERGAAGVDASNLVAVLNQMEDAGMIVRRRDRADRRRGVIELSPKGELALREVDVALTSVDDELLMTLDADQRACLNELLVRATEGVAGGCASAEGELADQCGESAA
jgi:DNA-binding MarR family transcriptional regulator